MARTRALINRLRQPAYTGENRCVPCTVTNLTVAGLLGSGVGYGAATLGADTKVAVASGVFVFALGSAAVYLRGYLVPGTPTLTKRYLPDPVLARFGKGETPKGRSDPAGVDVEASLVDAGLLAERSDGDLRLAEGFAREWREQIREERESGTGHEALAAVVGVDTDGLSVERFGDGAFRAVHDDTGELGRWESRAAFLADAAAGRLLPEYHDGWDRLDPAARGELLAGLRLFVERCPACDGPVRFGQDVVESCCLSYDVVAVTCEDCGARVFEIRAEDLAVDSDATV